MDLKESLTPNFKLWLSNSKGEYIIGEGGAKVLEAINNMNDLGKAAQSLNISYRKAWNIIQKIKKNYGYEPVLTYKGGSGGGGGMELTQEGKDLLEFYLIYKQKFNDLIKENNDYD